MSNLAIYLMALAALAVPSAARHMDGKGLQDLAAFPKYEVQFLNDLPISQSDAQRCREYGLEKDDDWLDLRPNAKKLIEGSSSDRPDAAQGSETRSPATSSGVSFLPLRYSHPGTDGDGPHAYLCALPSSNATDAQAARAKEAHDEPQPDPVASWAALDHLNNRCLYTRHQWFTYAYCHNSHIRQFREARSTQPNQAGGYEPTEDTQFEGYTLGRAHPAPKGSKGSLPPGKGRKDAKGHRAAGVKARGRQTPYDGANSPEIHGQPGQTPNDGHHLSPEQTATFGVGPASRFLVQRWSDGTRCDKTGKPREVEVQVHCSMTGTDSIYMIKEVAICQYVVVIHSPHLCSLPGFRPESGDDITPVPIRCRQIVQDELLDKLQRQGEETDSHAARGHGKVTDAAGLLRLPASRSNERTGADKNNNQGPDAGGGRKGQAATKLAEALPAAGKNGDGRETVIVTGGDGTQFVIPADELAKLQNLIGKAFGAGQRGDDGPDGHGYEGYGEGEHEAAEDEYGHVYEDHLTHDPSGHGGDRLDDELFLISWETDEEGNDIPLQLDSVPPSTGEDRRAFLERLQRLIASELEGEAEGEGESSASVHGNAAGNEGDEPLVEQAEWAERDIPHTQDQNDKAADAAVEEQHQPHDEL